MQLTMERQLKVCKQWNLREGHSLKVIVKSEIHIADITPEKIDSDWFSDELFWAGYSSLVVEWTIHCIQLSNGQNYYKAYLASDPVWKKVHLAFLSIVSSATNSQPAIAKKLIQVKAEVLVMNLWGRKLENDGNKADDNGTKINMHAF